MRQPKLRLIAGLVVLVALLSSCAKLPTSSEVKVGSDIQSGLTADYLYYSPSGPSEDASQTDIINGFLNAATGPQNDYQVAREYLAGNLAAQWNPSNELLIAEARPVISVTGETSARISFNALARIDSDGRYHDLGAGLKRQLNFEFTNESGQWRISSAPDATVLVRPVFDVLFKSYSLYFYDKQNRYLIPDLRWYATRVSTTTRLVSALLAGPSAWLSDAVQTAFPSKSKLAIDSVTVENGTAIVDLDSSANHATVYERQRMLTQLTATLTQLANIFDVEIRIDHVPQKITNLPYEVSLATNPDPIVLTADGFKALNASNTRMKEADRAAASWAANDFAINNQQTLLALKSSLGVGVVKLTGADRSIVAVDTREKLLSPVIDPQGFIWTLGAHNDSALLALSADGAVNYSLLGWLGAYEHKAMAISREGGRIAFLVESNGKRRLLVSAIVRNSSGVPISVSAPIEIGQNQFLTGTITWIDDTTIGAITRDAQGLTFPVYLQVGGEIKKFSPVANAVSVVANGLYASAYVLDTSHNLHVLRSLTWINSDSNVLAIHFAG